MLWNCDKKHNCRRNCEIQIVNLHCEKDHCENKGFGKQKQKWSLSTMQNHNEHFITVYRKMKLQIQLLKIHCWIDDICVIAEDDPVRTLRLASDHICGTCIQLTSANRPYSMHDCSVYIVENSTLYSQIILTGCIFVMGIEPRSRNPQLTEVLSWFAVICYVVWYVICGGGGGGVMWCDMWYDMWCECCLRF